MHTDVVQVVEMLSMVERHRAWVDAGHPETGPVSNDRLSLFDARVQPVEVFGEIFEAAELIRCNLSGSTFVRCDFSAALLIDSVLRDCKFLECCFRKADLSSADCTGSNFTGCDMTRADLTRAILQGAILDGCDMGWSWLVDTDLRLASLEDVKLDGARLSGAKVYNTRRFRIGPLDRAVIRDVYSDPDATGPAQSGAEALAFLRADGESPASV